jgi:hypothetical protein
LTDGCAMIIVDRHTTTLRAPNLCSGGVDLIAVLIKKTGHRGGV